MLVTRRGFLKAGATLVAASWAVPSFIAETARQLESGPRLETGVPAARAAGRRVLVLVQLSGGNDGVNTLVPYGDPVYYSSTVRPGLAIHQAQVLPLSSYVGLHPSLSRLKARYDQGQVAVVQGVSYPNPNRSHFRGMDIWETGVPDRLEAKGWMGRYLEACACQREDHLEAMAVGSSQVPGTLWTEMALVPAVASLGSFRYAGVGGSSQRTSEISTLRTALAQADGRAEAEFLRQSILTALTDADILANAASSYTPVGVYPTNGFGNSMKLIAQLIAADVGTHVFFLSLGGFDTHSDQLAQHASLLSAFDQAVDALFVDLDRLGRTSDVTVMTFSEFGRRLAQNGSFGTDHGVSAPLFLVGGALSGGLHSTHPSLTDLTSGDLKMAVDFRSVYATVLQDWLQVSPSGILGGSFPTLGLFSSNPPGGTATPTLTGTPTETPTPTPTSTPTPTPTLTPTATATSALTPTPTPTPNPKALLTGSHTVDATPLVRGRATVVSTVEAQDGLGQARARVQVRVRLIPPTGKGQLRAAKTGKTGGARISFRVTLPGAYRVEVTEMSLRGMTWTPGPGDVGQPNPKIVG